MALDAKLRTSIVEGISVFLSLFDQPDVAGVRRAEGNPDLSDALRRDAEGDWE